MQSTCCCCCYCCCRTSVRDFRYSLLCSVLLEFVYILSTIIFFISPLFMFCISFAFVSVAVCVRALCVYVSFVLLVPLVLISLFYLTFFFFLIRWFWILCSHFSSHAQFLFDSNSVSLYACAVLLVWVFWFLPRHKLQANSISLYKCYFFFLLNKYLLISPHLVLVECEFVKKKKNQQSKCGEKSLTEWIEYLILRNYY